MSESSEQSHDRALPGEAGPRITSAIGRVLRRELPLALRAAHHLRARPAILLVVLLLTSVGFAGGIVATEILLRRSHPEYRPDQSFATASEHYRDVPFWQRRLLRYQRDPVDSLVLEQLVAFCGPLRQPTHLADQWIGVLVSPLVPRARELPPWRMAALMVSMALPMAAVYVLVFVALVGWIKDQNRRPAVADLRRYWRAYYGPALAVELIGLAAYSVLQMPIYIPSWQSWIFRTPLAYLMIRVLMRALAVAFMLAPYVVVARGVGAWNAIIEGWRLLGRRWFALVTLFVLYWVGYEVLNVWEALSPWPAYRSTLSLSIPAPVMWLWIHDLGLALLGLWLAYALVEIAKGVRMVSAQCGNGAQAPSPVC